MTDLPLRTFSQIVADQEATLASSLSVNTDIFQELNLTPGSPLLALMEANGGLALWLQYMNWKVLRSTRMVTSVGSDLDTFGADFRFARFPATPATGQVFFERATANNTIYIPNNSVMISKDGTQSFVVVPPIADPTHIYDPVLGYRVDPNVYIVSVLVEAVTPGSGGNISANSLKLQTSLAVNKISNPTAFQNGADAESDQNFISRFRLYISSLSRATPSALENAIITTNPKYTYTILENYIAIGQPRPGCILINFDDGTGLGLNISSDPSQQTIAQAQVLGIVNELKDAIEAVRPAGVTVFVQTAQAIAVSVQMETLFANTTQRLSSVAQIQLGVTNYLNTLGVGQTLFYTKLVQVIYNSCPNLQDLTNLKLSGIDALGQTLVPSLAGDLIISSGQVLRFIPSPPVNNGVAAIQRSTITIDY